MDERELPKRLQPVPLKLNRSAVLRNSLTNIWLTDFVFSVCVVANIRLQIVGIVYVKYCLCKIYEFTLKTCMEP